MSNNNPNLKKGGGIALVIALLVLAVNMFLNQRGGALPADVTDAAESVVVDSLGDNPFGDTDSTVDNGLPSEALDAPVAVEEPPIVEEATDVDPDPAAAAAPAEAVDSIAPLWVNAAGDFDYYVLALSWQPAFCETKSYSPECRSQVNGRYDASHFVLHGLWPNLRNDPNHEFAYCNQSAEIVDQDYDDWCQLPALSLDREIESELSLFMPGSASCLQNHEWYKHGVCSGMSDDAYFALSAGLVELFGATSFNRYVADHIGQEVSRGELLGQFEDEFGAENSDYLSLRCTEVEGISILSEIRLVLKREIGGLEDFSDLFPAETVRPQGSCPSYFIIDGVN